ncbi:MAG: GNAT family N-acetyltransferase [Deltaproteobacteria bacterium]|nr:GNAT family N-acetyltransferase [Deltaproteobacteria bacterium]
MILKEIVFRQNVQAQDPLRVEELVRQTGFFSDEEIQIARELVEEHLQKGSVSGYFFLFAESNGRLAGYSCFGPIPATAHSFDLYWIAVHPAFGKQGLGKTLQIKTEAMIAALGGQNMYAETSGREQYAPTRAFYRTCGYLEAAVLADFYATGDAKHIFVKTVTPGIL